MHRLQQKKNNPPECGNLVAKKRRSQRALMSLTCFPRVSLFSETWRDEQDALKKSKSKAEGWMQL